MPKELYVDRPQHVVIREYKTPALKETQILIKSEFSAIKHGTEFHLYSGKSPYATMKFDSKLRIFVKKSPGDTDSSYKYPGNIAVGRVIETGKAVKKFQVGDRVYAYAKIREAVIAEESKADILTPPMSEQDTVCTDPAFYAFVAARDANVRVGDNVVLFGLGAIGLFVVQLLRLSGCMEIIAVDPIKKRRDLAKKFGATLVLDPTGIDVAQKVHSYLNKGADVAIEGSGNYRALHTAMRSVRMCGKIVTFGYYKGKDKELCLGQEWHHNRLTLISSMPWNNPSREYPLWDDNRLKDTVKRMFIKKLLTSKGIVDPIVDFSKAAKAYMSIYKNPKDAIKLGVRFKQ